MKSRSHSRRTVLSSLLLTLASALFLAGAPLSAFAKPVPGEILVGLRPEHDNGKAVARIAEGVGQAAEHLPKLHVRRIKLRPGLSVEEAIAKLQRLPEVVYAEANNVVYASSISNDPALADGVTQFAPRHVYAHQAWDLWVPKTSVVIAIVDTGTDTNHPDLTNVIYRDGSGNPIDYDYINNDADATDDQGHGTHCAGIAAAQTNNEIGMAGIAGWNGKLGTDTSYIKLMPVKVLAADGSGTDLTVAQGITFAADNGAKVISLSLGSTSSSTTLNNAVQSAWNRGCILVAAAGNSGSSTVNYPAGYANVIAVASVDSADKLSSFSNWGSWVDTAAPGSPIYSTMPTYHVTMNDSGYLNNYDYLSGTSMATPHVAGEAALLLAHRSSLTNASLSTVITTNVDPYTPYSTTFGTRTIAEGGGRINVYKALQDIEALTAPTGLAATAVSSSQIDLSWSDASTNEKGFKIERSTDGVNFVQVGTVGTDVTTYSSTGLAASTAYTYRVLAYNNGGDSAESNSASATTLEVPAPPAAPTYLAAKAVSRSRIDLTWVDNATNETGFKIERWNGSAWVQIATTGVNVTSFSNTGLARRTTYYYRVRAYNEGGNSGYSNEARATTYK